MKKIVIILLTIILMLSVMACAPNDTDKEIQDSKSSRMVIIETTLIYQIVYDRYTKVMYAISVGGYNSGNFTLLVDSDGSPLLYGN